MSKKIRITTQPGQLNEGLFGQIFLHIFEVLPYLDSQGIRPAWAISSTLYGAPSDFVVIPGLLEINYNIEAGNHRDVNLLDLRYEQAVILGGDWDYAFRLWSKFFRWPERVRLQADGFPSLTGALGLHYRGTDKNQSQVETNPVTPEDFLALAGDFVATHPDLKTLYVATDENSFLERVRAQHPSLRIVDSGAACHHKDGVVENNLAKGDHALLDCLLLSRCRYLVKCQSALSGFAKILNPQLEAYRVSANKSAWWTNGIPYFPDAYLPKLQSGNVDCQKILDRLLAGDWTDDRRTMEKYGRPFTSKRRKKYTVKMPPRWTLDGLHRRIEKRIDVLARKLGR